MNASGSSSPPDPGAMNVRKMNLAAMPRSGSYAHAQVIRSLYRFRPVVSMSKASIGRGGARGTGSMGAGATGSDGSNASGSDGSDATGSDGSDAHGKGAEEAGEFMCLDGLDVVDVLGERFLGVESAALADDAG